MKSYLLFINAIIFTLVGVQLNAQGLEIDISYGIEIHQAKLVHTEKLNVKNLDTDISNQYSLGVTNKVYGNIFLRTELGIINSRTSLNIEYFVTGLGVKRTIGALGSLYNEQKYISLLPEYRQSFGDLKFYINAGLIVSDMKYRFSGSTGFEQRERNNLAITTGFAANIGLVFNAGRVGFKINTGLKSFQKSAFFGAYEPMIKYTFGGVSVGVVYGIGK